MQAISRNWRAYSLWAGASVFMTLAQLRLVVFVLGKLYPESINAAASVISGTPAWAINQSRVLAPYSVAYLSVLMGGNFGLAHVIFMCVMTFISGLLFLVLTSRLFGRQAGWFAFVAFHMLFSTLLNEQWLLAWDHYSIIAFTLFVYFVMADKSWRWFTALFAVAIFNRESALFIALWMVLHAICTGWSRRPSKDWWRHINWPQGAAGLLCGMSALAILRILRTTLLVHEQNATPGAVHNLLFMWPQNVETTLDAFTSNFGMRLICPGFLAVTAAIAIVLARRNPPRFLALSLTHLALVVSIFLFGVITETRVMLELVPFVIFGLLWLNTPETRNQAQA